MTTPRHQKEEEIEKLWNKSLQPLVLLVGNKPIVNIFDF